MNLLHFVITAGAALLLPACDSSVALEYSTKAAAAADSPFARGWLPDIIPASSREISMRNDLDLNLSYGDFSFDARDHDLFAGLLARLPARDEKGFSAYSYKDWIFLLSNDKNYSRFSMQLGAAGRPTGG